MDVKKQKRWVLWNAEKVNGRMTKIPYTITGKRASSTNPDDWTTYAKARAALKLNGFGSGIGVIFTPEQTLLGIDIDHIINPETKKIEHEKAAAIETLIKEASTYTETSPSGTGLHLYLSLDGPLALEANRHAPFEAYTSGRFFTYSETPFTKTKAIRNVSTSEALRLLSLIGYPWSASANAVAPKRAQAAGSLFTDEEVLDHMFRSKNGEAIRKLYDGDTSAYDKDDSRADAALLNHFAFWTRKDQEQMDRLWLASPLGKRAKTQKRIDYRNRSIAGAIKNCKEVYRTQEERVFEEFGIEFLFTLNSRKEQVITQNTENIARILREHPKFQGRFRYDAFTNAFEILDGAKWRAFEDNDAVRIQTDISVTFECFQKVGKDMVYDAIMLVAKERMYDSAIDYITGIQWDGVARLDTWLTSTFGTPDDVYHRAVASNWIKGMVKRITEPGCKFDYVLVLEGEQGAKKSTSLHVLGKMPNGLSGHVETTMSTDSKDFFMQFSGKFIIEFSEGETLSRTEVKKMKAIITMQSDKFREPYARISLDHPRRCVFAMTTNQDEYLKDETGNRRWLPVKVLKDEADIAWLEANRDQILGEAYHRLQAGESIYEFPKEETIAQQEARRVSDPNEDKIADWYYEKFGEFGPRNKEEGITIQEVYAGALGGVLQSMKKHEEMAITDVLKRVLKLTKVRRMIGGRQAWRWVENPIALPTTEEPVHIGAADPHAWDDLGNILDNDE